LIDAAVVKVDAANDLALLKAVGRFAPLPLPRVVEFKNPRPAKPIPNLAEKLVAEEAGGILNWLIEGALAYRAEMEKHGQLILTNEQQGRVATLLQDSDNVPQFVKNRLVARTGHDVTSEELLLGYHKTCRTENWTPVMRPVSNLHPSAPPPTHAAR
jgi:hypothetical protein